MHQFINQVIENAKIFINPAWWFVYLCIGACILVGLVCGYVEYRENIRNL